MDEVVAEVADVALVAVVLVEDAEVTSLVDELPGVGVVAALHALNAITTPIISAARNRYISLPFDFGLEAGRAVTLKTTN